MLEESAIPGLNSQPRIVKRGFSLKTMKLHLVLVELLAGLIKPSSLSPQEMLTVIELILRPLLLGYMHLKQAWKAMLLELRKVAPKARLVVYKVCSKNSYRFDSDILSAFDAAVNDGVDVISISIGGGDGISSPNYLGPSAIGSIWCSF
ncbi:Subtilisin-like protease [Olea europaea subsp. europaea]|uniref:Subtilisin-like protease n=1 Tax=Olea europaea subsp. europaea TaxID=158383 RepID=A0A8S0R900_OLEEU|nr:Subtilisin-like protease [Olea europaea subsp. europaea]